MVSLPELQAAFAGALQTGDASSIAPHTVANGIEPGQRVAIYANNVRETFLTSLEAAFPVLVQLAGRDWFRQAGTDYRSLYPSRSGDLHTVGERFAAFLETVCADGPYAYFADVARLERAYQEVLVAAEPAVLDLAGLAAIAPERQDALVFEVSPAARLVGSTYPLLEIWRANQPGADGDATVHLDAGACRLLVIRRHSHVELRALAPGEFAFLTAIMAGGRVVDAATAALDADSDFELATSLPRLLRQGVLTGFHLHNAETIPRSLQP